MSKSFQKSRCEQSSSIYRSIINNKSNGKIINKNIRIGNDMILNHLTNLIEKL